MAKREYSFSSAYRLGAQTLGITLALLAGCTTPASDSPPVMDRTWLLTQKIHEVSAGETLYSVARQYGQTIGDLAALNNLSSPWVLHSGQQLVLVDSHENNAREKQHPIIEKKHNFPSSQGISRGVKFAPGDAPSFKATSFLQAAKNKTPWYWPVRGAVLTPFSLKKKRYTGIAIAGRMGEAVRATADGKVVYSGAGLVGYGHLVIIRHPGRYISAYGHNSVLLVREGEWVKAGQKIAELGSTGTDRPKLHFEIRHKGEPVNPLNLLPRL
ncbi:MAG: peptidoglycan DD-metalloendopeptidase family protein [Kistimonas sp.]|nr:peptidoglycan DD-metalloendopeptidase family protein [Kistimonas sp.]